MTKQGCVFSLLKIYTEILANKLWQGKEIKIYKWKGRCKTVLIWRKHDIFVESAKVYRLKKF